MPPIEQDLLIASFLAQYFGGDFQPSKCGKEEAAVIESVAGFVSRQFVGAKYVLGLALDFTLLGQQVSMHDPEAKTYRRGFDKDALFRRYARFTARGGRTANTLTVEFGGQSFGIRRIEEAVVDLFLSLSRVGYPSAYVYNTGQWHKFQDTLLGPCFSLSESGRYLLCRRLIEFGLANLSVGTRVGRPTARVRMFDLILRGYPRRGANENAGAVFQGIAAGYVQADRPHLALVVDKTRTGSARQSRIGDIDGYHGLDLELTCEVKDEALDGTNVTTEVGEFLSKVRTRGVMGLVIVQAASDEAVAAMTAAGAVCMPLATMIATATTWDWRKQDLAVNGLLHSLAHVEQNPDAVRRLLAFIRTADPTHDSLAYYQDASS